LIFRRVVPFTRAVHSPHRSVSPSVQNLPRALMALMSPATMHEKTAMTVTPASETSFLNGLYAKAEMRINHWGVPRIRAASEKDLFFVQGFNAARDRLWQVDLWRKRGLGLLAADFGPGYLAQDHAARHFLYRGDMGPEWTSYAPDTQAICTAFVAGINAY